MVPQIDKNNAFGEGNLIEKNTVQFFPKQGYKYNLFDRVA